MKMYFLTVNMKNVENMRLTLKRIVVVMLKAVQSADYFPDFKIKRCAAIKLKVLP